MSCWTLVESTVYKVNWLNLGEPKVQVQLPWSQIYHFMTDTTYSSSGRRRMIHEPSSHSCIFGPLTTRHLWFTVHIFHLPPFFCLFFLRVVVVILVHEGGSIHWRTKEDKMYVYGLWIWPHDLRIQFFFHRWDWLEEMWLSLANERVMTLTQAATCVTGLFPLSHLHSREPWI